MAHRSPYRRAEGRTWGRLKHFLWWCVGEEAWSTAKFPQRFWLNDGSLLMLSAIEPLGLPEVCIGRLAGWQEGDLPILEFDVPGYELRRLNLWEEAKADLESWPGRTVAWRVPREIFSSMCGENHPLSPAGVLFHRPEACLAAMLGWAQEVLLVEDPGHLAYRHYYPLSIVNGTAEGIPGIHPGESIVWAWKHEGGRVWLEDGAVHSGSLSWFQAEVKRSKPVFDKVGAPAGFAAMKSRVGPWYPMKAGHDHRRLPDPTADPDFLERLYPWKPAEVTTTWGDSP